MLVKEENIIELKLLGALPSSIKEISYIENIISCIDEELLELEKDFVIEDDLKMEYAQESKIDIFGSINISWRGLFTSKLYASKTWIIL